MGGYTQTPNEYFDALLPQITSLAELKVLSVAIRKTYGWQKEADRISVSQFMELTGMSRVSVLEGLKLCLKRGTLRRWGNKRVGFTYSVVLPGQASVEPSSGKDSLPPTKRDSKESLPIDSKESLPPSKESLPIMVKNLYPQKKYKETNSEKKGKENNSGQRPPPTPGQGLLMQIFERKIRLNTVQDADIAELEEKYGLEVLEKAARWMRSKNWPLDTARIATACKTIATGNGKPRAGPSPPTVVDRSLANARSAIEKMKRGDSTLGTRTS